MNFPLARLQHLLTACTSPEDQKRLAELLTDGTCEGAEGPCTKPGRLTTQNTAYGKDLSNWRRLCDDCQKENDAYWAERWSEYWSSVL